MKRRERPAWPIIKKREMQIVDVEMNDVELCGAVPDLPQHNRVMRDWIESPVEPQGSGTTWYKVRRSHGVPGCEQCDVVSLTDEFLRNP